MNHDDLETLLGVYALDALDPDEEAEVEEHLAECPRCRSEVAAYRNTAALLATPGGEAPPRVWDRIASELALDDRAPREDLPDILRLPPRMDSPSMEPPRVAPPAEATGPRHIRREPAPGQEPGGNVVPMRRKRRVALPGVAALATAAAVAAVVLGVSASNLNHRVNDFSTTLHSSGLQQAAAAAVLSPEHQNVQLTSDTTEQRAQVVILPNGNAYLVHSDLPQLDSAQTYQLWGLADGKAVSLGLLGANPQVVGFRVEHGVTRLMVTAEPKGGVPQPTTPVLVQGNVLA